MMTIYEIAKLAHVSTSTVSRVINKKPGIKQTTRERVEKILNEYHFHLNETARSLSTKSSKMIGIIVADIRNTHYTELAYETEIYLKENGYCSIINNAGNTPQKMEEALLLLSQRQVDGLIIIGSIFENKVVKNCLSHIFSQIPIIFLNGYFDNTNSYSILANEEQGVFDCASLLYSKAYTHIAFFSVMHTSSNTNKLNGYKRAIKHKQPKELLLDLDENKIRNFENDALIEFFATNKTIDGIICSDDYLAAYVMRYLQSIGINIPNDIGIIGIDNSNICPLVSPPLTSLDTKMAEMGQLGSQELINLLKNKPVSKKMMIFPEIKIRESIRS